jgi:electron transfer flavoprotein alpha subunit
MSVLVFVELTNGKFAKPAFEALTYGRKVSEQLNQKLNVVVLENASNDQLNELGKYGAIDVYKNTDSKLSQFEPSAIAKALQSAMSTLEAQTLILSFGYTAKAVAPILSARTKAGYVAGAISLPVMNGSEWDVKKNVFSGKAIAHYTITSAHKIIGLLPNSIPVEEKNSTVVIKDWNPGLSDSDFRLKSIEVVKASGTLSLTDAELVVSAGRGMKGPENWGMIEEMASILGAATACSRPVSDIHWRPHTEHVGQTGLAIRPNLYIAIGISGAIQHLAGVNGSKVIVVINKDAEAPFFKAADYGIVGDAFEIVPKLNEAFKKFKASSN